MSPHSGLKRILIANFSLMIKEKDLHWESWLNNEKYELDMGSTNWTIQIFCNENI